MVITRKQYLNGQSTHQEFYGQFISKTMMEVVKNHIGLERIKASTDPHLNDIPLHEWDRLNMKAYLDTEKWALAGNGINPKGQCVEEVTGRFHYSNSDNVCLAKRAARMLLENNSK